MLDIETFVIRPATSDDIEGLHRLLQLAYRGDAAAGTWSHEGPLQYGERMSREALANLMHQPRCRLFVADKDGEIAGSMLVESLELDECRIGLLSVAPAFQGYGLGNRLLVKAEAAAVKAFSPCRVTLEVLDFKSRLIAYYERRGYIRTGQLRPYPHELDRPAHFLSLVKPSVDAGGKPSVTRRVGSCSATPTNSAKTETGSPPTSIRARQASADW